MATLFVLLLWLANSLSGILKQVLTHGGVFQYSTQIVKVPITPPHVSSYLYQCNDLCKANQSCFLGKCYCLPGFGGPDCTTRTVYRKLDGEACPTFESKAAASNQESWQFPVEKCHLSFVDPISCAIFCSYQGDAGIVTVGGKLWGEVSDGEFDIWSRVKFNHWSEIAESDTRWKEYDQGFRGYRALSLKQNLGRYLEVGAGMFTQIHNLLTLRPDITVDSINLAEPNIDRYLKLDACLYKDKKLLGHDVTLISSTTEDLHMDEQFDTVLVVNTLEHVLDGFDFLTSIYKTIRPGGTLIFAERFFEDPDSAGSMVLGPAKLHPVRVRKNVLQNFLRHFDTQFISDFLTAESSKRVGGAEKGYYFVGKKKVIVDTVVSPSSEELDSLFKATQ